MGWFARKQASGPGAPGHLNNVLMGSGGDQRVVGFVDDGASVYDLSKRYLGSVDYLATGGEHQVTGAHHQVAGFVGADLVSVGGDYWHQVFDAAHQLVGYVDNGSELVTANGQRGVINFNEGNSGTGWRRAGAALLLLLLSN